MPPPTACRPWPTGTTAQPRSCRAPERTPRPRPRAVRPPAILRARGRPRPRRRASASAVAPGSTSRSLQPAAARIQDGDGICRQVDRSPISVLHDDPLVTTRAGPTRRGRGLEQPPTVRTGDGQGGGRRAPRPTGTRSGRVPRRASSWCAGSRFAGNLPALGSGRWHRRPDRAAGRLGPHRACRVQVDRIGQRSRLDRRDDPGSSRLFANRGLGGTNRSRRGSSAKGLGKDVGIGSAPPIVARPTSRHRATSRRDAGFLIPARSGTVVAAGFVGLLHDANELGRQLDPRGWGRASANWSDRWAVVERPLGHQRMLSVGRLPGLPRLLGSPAVAGRGAPARRAAPAGAPAVARPLVAPPARPPHRETPTERQRCSRAAQLFGPGRARALPGRSPVEDARTSAP